MNVQEPFGLFCANIGLVRSCHFGWSGTTGGVSEGGAKPHGLVSAVAMILNRGGPFLLDSCAP